MPSLFAMMFDPRRRAAFRPPPKRLAVWPYCFLGIVALVVGTAFVVGWWPKGFPDADELTMVSGKIRTVVIRDDISKTRAGAAMPSLISVYFTLEGVDDTFRYPSTHPQFYDVAYRTAGTIDVWVEAAARGTGEPVTIWQIQEHSEFNLTAPATFVAYDEVFATLARTARSTVRSGFWLLSIAAVLLVAGGVVRRINRSRPPVGP